MIPENTSVQGVEKKSEKAANVIYKNKEEESKLNHTFDS